MRLFAQIDSEIILLLDAHPILLQDNLIYKKLLEHFFSKNAHPLHSNMVNYIPFLQHKWNSPP